MSEANAVVPIEDLMDASIDDIADLPAFTVPPKGHYVLSMSLERKTINEKPAVEAAYVVQQVLELADKTEAPPAVGDKFSQLYFMDNEFGQGQFKIMAKALAPMLGLSNPKVGQLVAAAKNVKVAATLKYTYKKEDRATKERPYADVQNFEAAA